MRDCVLVADRAELDAVISRERDRQRLRSRPARIFSPTSIQSPQSAKQAHRVNGALNNVLIRGLHE